MGIFEQFNNEYNKAIDAKDISRLFTLLGNEFEVDKDCNKQEYVKIMSLKSVMAGMLGDFKMVILYSEEAYKYCEDREKWDYMVKWGVNYLPVMFSSMRVAKKQELLKLGLEQLNISSKLADQAAASYEKLVSACLRSFFALYLGDKEKARSYFNGIEFVPIPINDFNQSGKMVHMFSHIFKGFVVAIELQDKELLMNLLKVISIDDQILHGEENLFLKFQRTLADIIDVRKEFKADFDVFYRSSEKISDSFPFFHIFVQYLEQKNVKALDMFFAVFK
ncbi:MAG: hypothetical protein ACEPOV_02005 [Hyphomicrobiales bacterium]